MPIFISSPGRRCNEHPAAISFGADPIAPEPPYLAGDSFDRPLSGCRPDGLPASVFQQRQRLCHHHAGDVSCKSGSGRRYSGGCFICDSHCLEHGQAPAGRHGNLDPCGGVSHDRRPDPAGGAAVCLHSGPGHYHVGLASVCHNETGCGL